MGGRYRSTVHALDVQVARRRWLGYRVGVISVAMIACGGGGSGARTVIAIDGSSTVFPITEGVAEEFQRVAPDARVTVGISGTGGGFTKFCSGETDLSNASRPIQPVEIEACEAAGIGFIELPFAYGGIAGPTPERLITLPRSSPAKRMRRGDFTSREDDNVLVQGIATDELALVMGIMFLPTVSSLSEDALHGVPRGLREAAFALGATRAQTAAFLAVPHELSFETTRGCRDLRGRGRRHLRDRLDRAARDPNRRGRGHLSRGVTAFIAGCGKSTFLRTLNRMNDIIPGTRVDGRVTIDNRDIYGDDTDVVELRRRVGMVFQKSNPFPKSIFDNVAYGLRLNGLAGSRSELDARVEASLKSAALWDEVKDRLRESALALSGGQPQRLCIPPVKPLIDIPQMADIAQGMLRDALNAYVSEDVKLAHDVLDRDDRLDALKGQVFRELLNFILENPANTEPALDLIHISRHLERVGDHATNIAEEVIFIASGRDVRHHAQERVSSSPGLSSRKP